MSMPMSNLNNSGYNTGFGHGHQPSAPGAYGFVPGQVQGGYMPTYGEALTNYGVQQLPYGGGHQPSYGGQQPPYNGMVQPQPQYNGGPQGPIVKQPGMPPVVQPMSKAGDLLSIPRGLEHLTMIDKLLIQQKVELVEAFTNNNNKFSIKNALGQNIYYAVEDTNCCTRNMCGTERPFDMKVFDNFRNEVIHMYRPLACSTCCCLQSMEVSAPTGNVIGTVEQEWSICSPSFRIKNHIGDTVLRIEGSTCSLICGQVEFKVVSLTGETVGNISKQWSGLSREIFTDDDFFGITFPIDLDVRMKAVLLGATLLIHVIFFKT
ncbi:phospholipid scramblase 2-like isoform X2 [Zeugodacus cucurbitae]|uniref:phospholipid scramblase 2-like isoform X2 n=1 Tax=Zeugodacus cucurbitae TaxID=28588 RepID=UPI0005967A33|nr:phospholipid scramblase 2-like isoform X2 [Zeugodacus cucurbitae]